MKAVNLIPSDSRRGTGTGAGPQLPGLAIIGALAVAVGLVTIYVLTGNTISERQAKVTALQTAAARENAQAASLNRYVQFEQLAQTRSETVRQIASTRFDWHGALADLSKVVPANTSLQSLFASVAPDQGVGSSGAAGASGLRGYSASPALELTGCTSTQDDVARLISRLRLINGVTRVALADSQKPGSSGGASSTSSGNSSATGAGCGSNAPTFDLVVFFQPLKSSTSSAPGATGAPGATTASATATTPAATTTTPAATTPSTSTTPTTPTTPGAATTPSATGASK